MSFKDQLRTFIHDILQMKVRELHASLRELSDGAANESKSSAGDKHETGRAMAQLEQEKLSNQLKDLEQMMLQLEKNPGRLVKTDKGFLFICIAAGKIFFDGRQIMGISPQSPLGIQLSSKKPGESAVVNGTTFLVEEVL